MRHAAEEGGGPATAWLAWASHVLLGSHGGSKQTVESSRVTRNSLHQCLCLDSRQTAQQRYKFKEKVYC